MKNSTKSKYAGLFLAIPLLFLIIFTIIPLISVIYDSFFDMSYTKTNGFVGFDNYCNVFLNQNMLKSIWNSVYYMIAAVVQVIIALILSVLLVNSASSNFFKPFLFFPYLINGIAIGYMFRIFFSHGLVLDTLLQSIGFSLEQLPYWLRDQSINNWMLAAVSVWKYLGLSLVIFLGALSSVNLNCIKASTLDGAGKIRRFFYIQWPSIKNVVLIDLMLSVVTSLSEFEIPYAVASGGSNGTETYMISIFRIAFNERKIGLASAMTVILLIQIIIICWICMSTFRLMNIIRRG